MIINVSGTGARMQDFIDAGFDVRCTGNSKKSIKTFRYGTILKVRELLKEFRPDIIHTAHFTGDYFGRMAAKPLKIPAITHLHNARVPRKKFRRFINKHLSRYTSAYLCVSKEVQEYAEKFHNMAGAENILLYNAVDKTLIDSAEPADLSAITGSKGTHIITAGRLVKEKNYESLVKAFAIAHEKFPDTSLIIAGEGKKRADLEHEIQKEGLADNVFLPGYRNDVPSLLKGADIFTLVSHSEGFGTAHLEAMFAGLPAVISDKVPSAEICGGAALVCTTDHRDIAEKLIQLLSNKQRMKSMSAEALQVSSGYTMEAYMDKLTAIYEKVAPNAGR